MIYINRKFLNQNTINKWYNINCSLKIELVVEQKENISHLIYMPSIGDIKFHLFTFSDKNTMNVQNIPKSKWLASSGKIKQVVRLQNVNDPGGGGTSITVRQKVKMRPKAKPFIFSNIIILDFLSKLLSIFCFF